MRQSLLLLLLAVFVATSSFVTSPLAKSSKLTVEVKFINVVEGYDHENRSRIWIDDDLDGAVWTTTGLESKTQTATIQVPKGKHRIHLMNYAQYEGTWEEHTVANNYSLDVSIDKEYNFKKKSHKLSLEVDIEVIENNVKLK
jgi:hypothetical protein